MLHSRYRCAAANVQRRGKALTDYFLEDVGITQFQFNVGQQLLFTGIVILEVRSDATTSGSYLITTCTDPEQPSSVQTWSTPLD
jgi:hypothetical protein